MKPFTVYQLSARVQAQSNRTRTTVNVYYKFQRGTPILIYQEKISSSNNQHLLNIEIKQKIPYMSDLNKCTIEFLLLIQNMLKQTDAVPCNGDWESEMLEYIPKGVAGGLVFHF
jgi:hypothetical protein